MTDPDDDDLYLRSMIEKKRKVSSYWDWPDKPVKERGIALNILPRVFKDVVDLTSLEPGQIPPDCANAPETGNFSGVEVTELVDQKTLEQSIRGDRVYLEWDRQQFLSALQSRIDDKDKSWKGGPYERRVLVIHTDEFTLDRETVDRFLQGFAFTTKLITDVILGLSYHSSTEDVPVFRLILARMT